jgi:hypothetical protein
VERSGEFADNAFRPRNFQTRSDDEQEVGAPTTCLGASDKIAADSLTDTLAMHMHLVVENNAGTKLANSSGAFAFECTDVISRLAFGASG